jgi:hypothetical protein
MSWERDTLWAKARLFFERAFNEPRESPLFCLWCSLGLELLARAALASVSPTLLAEPDQEHKHLLHALKRGSQAGSPRSIGSAQVFKLCNVLFSDFSKEDLVMALALTNRRNDELHTGSAAFDEYPSKLWLAGFYRACRSLATAMGESLESLFGKQEAKAAIEILKDVQEDVKSRTLNTIAAHRKVFEAKMEDVKRNLAAAAKAEAERLSHQRHHRADCPACQSIGTLQGKAVGEKHESLEDGVIVLRQSVSPREFHCPACDLHLQGYGPLDAAGLGGLYTRRTEVSPEDYYGLIDPKTADLSPYIQDYLASMAADEYDNE